MNELHMESLDDLEGRCVFAIRSTSQERCPAYSSPKSCYDKKALQAQSRMLPLGASIDMRHQCFMAIASI